MTSPLRSLVVLAVAGLSIASVACTIGETRYETVKLPMAVRSETVTCDSPVVKVDLGKLKTCGSPETGKGHCYDKKKVPIPSSQLKPCEGEEVCVPDNFLAPKGKKLKSCKFFMEGKPGACVSLLVKDVNDNKAILQTDVCAADERCAPCINPIDQKDTHICDEGAGVHETDCTGGTAAGAKACCHGMGVCMSEEGAPADARENMERESCPEGNLCAPASQVSGKPVKCDVLGFSGVCLDLCFASMFSATTQVTRSSCGPTEMCMPCVLAKGQGMLGCD